MEKEREGGTSSYRWEISAIVQANITGGERGQVCGEVRAEPDADVRRREETRATRRCASTVRAWHVKRDG